MQQFNQLEPFQQLRADLGRGDVVSSHGNNHQHRCEPKPASVDSHPGEHPADGRSGLAAG